MKKFLLPTLLSFSLLFFSKFSEAITQIVNVQNYSFTPSNFTINLGDTVKWNWINGSHTTTALSVPSGATLWNANLNSGSTTFIYVPGQAGSYSYECSFHQGTMSGYFTVSGCTPPDYSSFIAININICNGNTANLNAQTSGATSYQWFKNDTLIAGATNSNYMTTVGGQYHAIAFNSCGSDTSPNTGVNILPEPVVFITSSMDSVCIGNAVTLVGNGAISYSWSPSSNLSSVTGDTVLATTTSDIDVIVQGTDFNGCTAIDTLSLAVLPAPDAGFTFTESNDIATFTNTSSGATNYHWDFGDGASDTVFAPVHEYSFEGLFTIQLIATNANGCSDTVEQTITIVGVNEIEDDQFGIFYNDAASQIIISSKRKTAINSINLFDISGRKLKCDTRLISVNAVAIDTKNLSKGIYFLEINTVNGNMNSKFIVR
ncbi:MAG TPA: hypothetical protein DCQ93_04445 [Bacteroidetes bacterium]|nr:hypothetical protein [Bacteroidota bacterium]